MHKVIILSLAVILLFGGIIIAQQQNKNPAEESSSSSLQRNHTVKDEDRQENRFDCLPDEVTLKDVVTYNKGNPRKNITVKDKLLKLKAQCENGKLVDEHHKEIRFFRVQCWGNPPADYKERQQLQQDELKKMEKKYTVVVLGCNPLIQ